jgi:hypothetical protein
VAILQLGIASDRVVLDGIACLGAGEHAGCTIEAGRLAGQRAGEDVEALQGILFLEDAVRWPG